MPALAIINEISKGSIALQIPVQQYKSPNDGVCLSVRHKDAVKEAQVHAPIMDHLVVEEPVPPRSVLLPAARELGTHHPAGLKLRDGRGVTNSNAAYGIYGK